MSSPKVVADIGLNHNGDLDRALRMCAIARTMGADYVKFQKRTIEKAYTKEYLDKPRQSKWGTTVREEKYGLEFDETNYKVIDTFCTRQGIKWFASPRDIDSVKFLAGFGVPFMKVASGSLVDFPLLDAICDTSIPMILSTGMAYGSEIDSAIRRIRERDGRIAYILHCVSLYPQPQNQMHMARIKTLKDTYGDIAKIGFSNHSESIIHCIQAAVLGAEMIEFHITEDRDLPGPDHHSSIGPTGFKRIIDHLKSLDGSMGDPNLNPTQEELDKGKSYPWRQK